MIKLKRNKLIYYLCIVLLIGTACNQNGKKSEQKQIILSSHPEEGEPYSWLMKRAGEVNASGADISSSGFNTDGWMPAVIPGTALTSLVNDGKFPDPYFGQNNMRVNKIIPDIADVGRDFYHFWYRTSFTIPESMDGKRIWMQFDGINYIAHIYLNGQALGDMKGMFLQKKFDITELAKVGQENVLAVSVEPVEYPGTTQSKSKEHVAANENRNGGDGEIGKNVTMLMTAGWDFTFHDGIRDRNTGIWRDVKVFGSGDVQLENPFVKSELPIPELCPARETVSFQLVNSSHKETEAVIEAHIEDTSIHITKKIKLNPGEKREIILSPDEYAELVIDDPQLWWPVNKGEQHLYTLNLKVKVDGKISDELSQRFGIRDIRSDRNTPDGSRIFYVNGKRLFIHGSNWIPEAMLKTSKDRMYAELRYTRQAGINLLRLWGGGISESDYFFDLCDELGILVWHEFWMTGDTKPPVDTTLYYNNVRSTIKRIRNHPSLAYYVSSNEQDNIIDIEPILTHLDGTRGYQVQSECCGVHDGSPYKYENPMQYYDNTASDRGSRIDGFCPEYGTACTPVIESLRKMMPKQDLWPINEETWDYLDGNGFHNMTTKYRTAIEQYGKPKNIEDYAEKGQLVGAVAYRSIWENWNYNKYEYGDRFASGVLFWYHNSPAPQVCSRMWDWYLEPTAALYFSQDALEPIHAQFDFIKNTVSVTNDLYEEYGNLQVRCRVINSDMTTVIEEGALFDLGEDAVKNDVLQLDLSDKPLTPVHFIKLEVYNNLDSLISDSFYWRSTDEYKGPWTVGGPLHGGFESFADLQPTKLTCTQQSRDENGRRYYTVTIQNNSDHLAFFNRLKVMDTTTDNLVNPAFYSDNYFSLLPGESKVVTIDFALNDLENGLSRVELEGFNTDPVVVTEDR
ncbi:glycoside hydrolase family 2 protein [Mangrovibacterium diazotrophicum]|uniref:Glycosyl hydrolase family 2 n=1 Tax=Mangrovibacterium diazotrophicum TaxID=1261403 RepID=A0A419W4E7_9BACT|nr:sugar-binding domain-containing protein [Mangrovibacterium diazotrophicum]RKD90333.1 glycosyl hydrolase family 2 [Mangrovibacterium diazotrophicum]